MFTRGVMSGVMRSGVNFIRSLISVYVKSRYVTYGYVIGPGYEPARILDLVATPDDTEMLLEWTAPDAGENSITDYIVEYKTTVAGTWTVFSDGVHSSVDATVTGLTNDVSYDFRVAAVSNTGTAEWSIVVSETPVGF